MFRLGGPVRRVPKDQPASRPTCLLWVRDRTFARAPTTSCGTCAYCAGAQPSAQSIVNWHPRRMLRGSVSKMHTSASQCSFKIRSGN